jgi:hypothetical protein
MIKRLRSTHDDRRNGIKESNALVIQGKLISVGKDDGDGRLLVIVDLLQVLSQHLLPAGMSNQWHRARSRSKRWFRSQQVKLQLPVCWHHYIIM